MTASGYSQKDLFLTLAVTLLCFGLTYLFLGFYYVEYEGLHDSFYSGKLSPGIPFRSLHFLANMGTSHFYSYLYEKFPNIEWISWIFYSCLFVASFIGLYIVAELLRPTRSLTTIILVQIGVYFLIFADHNIHFIYTRVSYMSCGLSLIALIVFFDSPKVIKSHPWLFLFLNLFFTLGTLTRVESAAASISLLLFWVVFYLQNIRQLIRLFLYPILLVGSLIIAISYDIKTSKEFYKQIEPDIEVQYCERENSIPLSSMKTHRDSVLYNAALSIMWSDPRIMTPTYLRSLIRSEKLIYTDAYQWSRTYRNISDTILENWQIVLLCLFLTFAVYLQYDFRRSKLRILSWLAFECSFWVLITMQTYTFKIVDRSFLPFMSLFMLCHIIILIRHMKPQFSLLLYPIYFFCTILFFVCIYDIKVESIILKRDLSKYQDNTKTIQKLASNHYLVLNSSSCDFLFLSNTPFHPFDFSNYKKVYITDGYNIPFLPYYRKYLEKECHCNMYDYPSFWNYLRTVHSDVIIVSEARRMDITTNYLQEIHHYILPVKEDSSVVLNKLEKSDARENFVDLKVYRLAD